MLGSESQEETIHAITGQGKKGNWGKGNSSCQGLDMLEQQKEAIVAEYKRVRKRLVEDEVIELGRGQMGGW